MKLRHLIAVLLTVVMLISALPVFYAADGVEFSFSSDVPSGNDVTLGDTVTYTVALDSSSGFSFGTLFFEPSDNLAYVSATLKGESVAAEKAITGENAGAYGIMIIGSPITGSNARLCTITFKVVDEGDISVRFYAYQLTNGASFITPTVNNGTVSHRGKIITTPTITTDSLPEAVMGYSYSYKLVGTYGEFLEYSAIGSLPSGLTLSPDGTISGTPTLYGSFQIVVKATLLDRYESAEKTLTLTILEEPRELQLTDGSVYNVDGEYLAGVAERTTLEAFLSQFKNNSYVKVYDGSGREVSSSSALVGTGYTVSLMHGGERVHTLTVIVLGDVGGNGRIDATDYQRIKMHIFGSLTLEGAYFKAALVSGRANITAMDFQRVKIHIFGTINLHN